MAELSDPQPTESAPPPPPEPKVSYGTVEKGADSQD